jgi:NAD(P)-dependent dehydrogenase (short-subunit alcohol dehydrogenase family)
MSYAFCAKAAVPLMRRNKGGAIVNVASVRSVVAGGGNLQYDTTKAAVAGLTRALAADHSPEGIRVNAVGPGPIFTPFHQRRIAAAGETVEQYNAKVAQGTELGMMDKMLNCITLRSVIKNTRIESSLAFFAEPRY